MHFLSESLPLAGLTDCLIPVLGTIPSILTELWDRIWPVLLLAFGFGMVIFVHELGHFLAAKWVGIRVDVFSLGFGKRLLGVRRGETDYRISVVPLGGYVKMLGQDDLNPGDRTDDERSLCNKTIGQRLLVFSAGVTMNLIAALVMFIILFRFTGVSFQRSEVGYVRPGGPAEVAGILPGDAILTVNGKAVRDFGELRLRIALAPGEEDISMRIKRPGREHPFDLAIQPESNSKAGVPEIGISGPATLTVADPGDYTELRDGDAIVGLEYDGRIYTYDKYYKLDDAINARRAKPTNIIAERDSQRLAPIMILPRLLGGSHVMGLLTPTRIGLVSDDSPAELAGLIPGDIIVSLDGHIWPDMSAVFKLCRLASREPKEVPISVLRAGKTIELIVKTHKKRPLGIEIEPDYQHLYVANDYPELYEAKDNYKGLKLPAEQRIDAPAGAKLLKLNGKRLANWSDFIDKLEGLAGSKAKLKYSLGGKNDIILFSVPSLESPMWKQQWRFAANFSPYPDEMKVKADSLPGAAYIGLHKTWFWLQSVYLTLTRVVQGSVKTTALSGPVGIFNLGITVAKQRGPAHFFYLMAIIGVNLAIVNFLPIPVLDGGHALFLLFEKIKGSPVSVRVQTIATTVGLSLIGVFFLFVTYRDVVRWLGFD